jgi:integrase
MAYVINRGTKDRPRYYAKYRDVDGKWKQKATHQPTMKEAQRFVGELDARIARGMIGVPEVSDKAQRQLTITVAELANQFLAEYNRPKLRNRERHMSLARSAFRHRLFAYPLARLTAASVRRLDVQRHRDALRAAGYSNRTVNISLAWLSCVYTWANEMELIDCRNPVSHIERMPVSPSEDRYSLEHVQRLLAPESRHPMIATALYTGMRKGELFGLVWDRVHFDRGCIEVKHSFDGPTKSGKPRMVPLHPELASILRDWQARCPATPTRHVFPVLVHRRYRPGNEHDMKDLRAILQAADCPDTFERPWHAMRHSFATLFAEAGGARDALERILGHSSGGSRITAGYVHLSVEYLAREMAKLTLQPGQPAKIYQLDAYRQHTVQA